MSDQAQYFAGFDASGYPGDEFMAWAIENTNLDWCGFYLTAPSHPSRSWMMTRPVLASQGWGLAPIFVGQQVAGPGEHDVTAMHGRVDAALAGERMRAAGFPPGCCVYLDLENGPPDGAAEAGYVAAWVAGVTGVGWQPGVYCSHLLAPSIAALVPSARLWCFRVSTTTAEPFVGDVFSKPAPAGCGFAEAALWQRAQNLEWHNSSGIHPVLNIDASVALMADPSAPNDRITAQEPA